MDNQQFVNQVKALLKQGDFKAARKLVQQSKHPRSDALLARIDAIEAKQSGADKVQKAAPKKAKRGNGSRTGLLLLLVVLLIGGAGAVLILPELLGSTPEPVVRSYDTIPEGGRNTFESMMSTEFSDADYTVSEVLEGSLERYFASLPADQANFERQVSGPNPQIWCVRIEPAIESYDDVIARFTIEEDQNGWRSIARFDHQAHRAVWEGACGSW